MAVGASVVVDGVGCTLCGASVGTRAAQGQEGRRCWPEIESIKSQINWDFAGQKLN